ncbi:MAG: hypothetical protein ACREIT_01105 [Tepidisphaeraceae bacterium]
MIHRERGAVRPIVVIIIVAFLLAGGALSWWLRWGVSPRVATVPATQPTTAPVTQPATVPTPPEPPRTYIGVVRANHADFPATQPLGVPVHFSEAAHLVLPEPIYLCPRGGLWITRSDGPETQELLRDAAKEQTHVVRDTILFVHWSTNDEGAWQPTVVRRVGDPRLEVVGATWRISLDDVGYDWAHAFSWNGQIVVPTSQGAEVIGVGPGASRKVFQWDIDSRNTTWIVAGNDGLLAWAPWSDDRPGSEGAARFAAGEWTRLTVADGWPRKILYLVPLLDGSVLRLASSGATPGTVELSMQAPAPTTRAALVDEKRVLELVAQLSNLDEERRTDAFQELTRFGPGAWPVLERVLEDQPPEARVRLQQLLRGKIRPTLGGMTPLEPAKFRHVARLRDGGAVLYADSGVSVPRVDQPDKPTLAAPAWLSLRPGRAVQLLPPAFVHDMNPERHHLQAFANEWIATDDANGPRRFMGNHWSLLLKKSERERFDTVVGFDRRGRWLFRNSKSPDAGTLIIDPTLPDPTPRLPVWLITVNGGSVGWEKDGWPVQKRGGAWALHETEWTVVDEKTNRMFTKVSEMPPATAPTTSTTTPITGPAPLLVDAESNHYAGGATDLRVMRPDGSSFTWPLPANAVGSAKDPQLLQTLDGKLFLFNEPGRVLRIARTPDGPEPFKVEATFTRKIPSIDAYERIWLDPAGRIVMAWDGNKLAILFPTGQVHRKIKEKMPLEEEE